MAISRITPHRQAVIPSSVRPRESAFELRPLLEAVLGRAIDDGTAPGTAAGLRSPVQALCRAARRRDLAIEQLLILVKEEWRSRPELRTTGQLRSDDRLARIVTLCIDEFFLDGADGPPGETRTQRQLELSD